MNWRRQMRCLAAAAAACKRGGGARSESQESKGNEQHLHGVEFFSVLE
jgi:hypothetical protein